MESPNARGMKKSDGESVTDSTAQISKRLSPSRTNSQSVFLAGNVNFKSPNVSTLCAPRLLNRVLGLALRSRVAVPEAIASRLDSMWSAPKGGRDLRWLKADARYPPDNSGSRRCNRARPLRGGNHPAPALHRHHAP